MNTKAFLAQLRRKKIRLWSEDGALRYKAPPGALGPEDLAELRRRKSEILELMRQATERMEASQTIEPVRRDVPPPLSFAQRRLWFLDQMGVGTAYNMPWAFVLDGELDPVALEAAINDIVARHEVLRTCFPAVDGKPVQNILPMTHLPLARVDLDDRVGEDQPAAVQRRYETEAARPFDLAVDWPIRPTLIRLGPREHVLILAIHHIAFDGWSIGVLNRELLECYSARTNGRAPRLPDLPLQYADFAHWQRQRLEGGGLERQLDYWRTQLAGLTPTELPTDRPRPVMQTFAGASCPFGLKPEATAALHRLSRNEGATLAMTLLAGFQVLLSRYTGQADVVVGSPIANRNRHEIENLIGFFVNSIAQRTDLSGDPTFAEVLRSVQETSLDGYEHQDVPFERLVDEIDPQRDVSRTPIFQVMFAMQNAPAEPFRLPGLEIRPYPRDTKVARFDLELDVYEHAGGVVGYLVYNTDLFDRATVERFATHLATLLESAAADPGRPISRLSMLGADERRALVAGGPEAGIELDAGPPWCIHARFEAQAARTPDATAVSLGDRRLSYAELNSAANRVAHRLRACGAGPDGLVGLCAERSLELVIGVLGILKAGAAYVPLDPTYPAQRLSFMMDDARMPLLLAQPHLLETIAHGSARVVPLDLEDATLAAAPTTNPDHSTTPENLAYVIYTSGSTGQPKGVLVEHRQVARLFGSTEAWFGFNEQDVWTLFHSCAFDFSVWELWGSLLYGGRLVVVPYDVSRAPDEFCGLVRREGVTVLNQTPSAFRQFMRAEADGDARELSLRHVIFGGEALELQSLRPWFERHDERAPQLVNMYGITETTVHVTYRPIRRADLDEAPGSVIGRPIPDLRVHVLDAHGEPMPIGVPGEMYVGGAGVARGYLMRPELTAARFVPDPFDPTGRRRLYRTGDVARLLPDGEIVYMGRNDDQVKIRGFRIELGEIEATLVQHPNVREAVATVREDEPGTKRLVAYVVMDGDDGALRAFATERLPSHMVPAAIVPLDVLPLTANGKIDRRALPAPDPAERRVGQTFVAPSTPEERTLAEIWATLLRVERVGVDDNFFELGGDSILSVQIIARAREAGLHLTPRDVFRYQTIGELAATAKREAETTLVPDAGPVVGDVPLTPIQSWLFAQERTDPHHYNQAFLFTLGQRIDAEIWRAALGAVIEHHDALRARFHRDDSGWRQTIVEPGGPVPLTVVDLATKPAAEQDDAVRAHATAAQASLDLADGPILRATLFDLGQERPAQLLIVVHHVAVDGVSWGILQADLERACGQLERGEPVHLPDKTVSVRQWSKLLHELAESPALLAQVDEWTHLATARTEIPTDGDASQNTVADAGRCAVALTEAETRRLLHDVPKAYGTQTVDVLLTAVARAFAEWTGRSELLIELEGHGRDLPFADVDVSRTVGWFTSMYPVRLDPGAPGDADLGVSLKRVKEQLRAVPDRGFGYGILRSLRPSPEVASALARVPVAPVVFNYLGQFDRIVDDRSLLRPTGADIGPIHSPRSRRSHLLEINGGISGGRLQLSLFFGTAVHRRETIERLAARFADELRSLIEHCTTPGVGGPTPSDFPLAGIDQRRLDSIAAEYGSHALDDVYPLSPMQQGMMYHTLRDPAAGVYVEQMRFRLDGLDADAFEHAWDEVMKRHPALRTAIVGAQSDAPLQIVRRDLPLPATSHDLRGFDEDAQRAWIDEFCRADQDRGFDLADPPLFRLAFMRLDDDRYELVWTFHHIVLDGWSFPRLLNEVLKIYGATKRGEAPALPRTRPYRDYIAWLRAQSEDEAEDYWRRTLADVTEPTPLGIADERGAGQRGAAAYGVEIRRLSEDETRALQALASRLQVTMNTLVVGAWSLLLARTGDVSDVVLGTVVSGRPPDLDGVESMVGMFVNTLPLRVPVPMDEPASGWMRAIQERQAELRQYEHSALWQAQQAAALPPGAPLFESLYVFENYPIDVSAVQETDLKVGVEASEERTGYPLTFSVSVAAFMAMRLTYDVARFESARMHGMLDAMVTALAALVADPDTPVGRIPLLSATDRDRVLVDWNDTTRPYPRESSVPELFRAQAARTPDRVSVTYGAEALTYATLDERSERLANYLQEQGITRGDRVAICVERGVDLVVAMLGVLKAGAAYVPLDPAHPGSRLALMLADTRARALLTHAALRDELPEVSCPTIDLDDEWSTIAEASGAGAPVAPSADDLAYVIYTSGSTGRPKGVCVPHRAIVRLVLGTDFVQLDASDRVAQIANASFDAATFEIWGGLLTGAQIVGLDTDTTLAPRRFADAIRTHGVTVMFVTTALFNQLETEVPGIFGSLHCLLFGGEAVDAARVRSVLENGAPRRLLHVYGPTENTTFSTWHEVESVSAGARTVSIGRPIANSTMYVLDPAGQPVPIGAPGELFVGGDGLAVGYLNDPELTASRFVPHPFVAGERLYRTGDLVRLRDDGSIDFVGRVDHQVKLRGFRIELGEIETALLRTPEVRDAIVLCREDEPGDKRLVAYVVATGDQTIVRDDLRTRLREALPEYMVPSAIVELDTMPLSVNGKVDRRALPAPDDERQVDERYVAPRSELEEEIAAIWRDVLETETVGVHDNFFDSGGHSLRLLRVHGRLRERGHEIGITELFEHPTIAALAARLGDGAAAAGAPRPAAVRGGRGGRRVRTDDAGIAIVGLGGRFPGARDPDAFWANARDGVEAIRSFDDDELRAAGVPEATIQHPSYVKAGSVLEDADLFDAAFFGYTPREAELIDPQQRVFLECAWEALERAGYDPERYAGLIGVYAGTSVNGYMHNLRSRPELIAAAGGLQVFISSGNDFLPTRVSYKLDLRGPSVNVQTACSTSLVAVHEACRSLLDGQCDLALAGGVSIGVPVIKGYVYQEGGIFSPDGHCRAFDAKGRGTLSGHGVGIVVLKRLAEAERDGDVIHAVIRGTAINNDGSNKVGYTAPSVEGQAEVIAMAQAIAGVDPASVTYIEAHGTATPLGDPIEVAALTRAFREHTARTGFCAIGSLKSNMGHLDAAAGVSGLIKTALALEHAQIPPSLHFESPNPEIDFDNSPFFVNTELRDWVTMDGLPRRAGVSSFGLGGTNAHAVVEQAPALTPSDPCARSQLLVVSAKTETALETATANLAAWLRQHPAVNLADVAHTLQLGRRQFAHRRAVVSRSVERAVDALEGHAPEATQIGRAARVARPVVFLFPGQGAQYVGMGRDLYHAEPAFREAMDRCFSYLDDEMSLDLRSVLYPDGAVDDAAAARLTSTAMAQPALFAVEYALAQTWRAWGIEPAACIGHSIGEFTAACIAGVLGLEDALRLVTIRGRLMDEMPAGAMTAVPLPEAAVRERLDGTRDLWLSTVNGPAFCVVSGPHDRVDAFESTLAADGVECRRLHTSHAFHSGMMDDAVTPFVEAVRGTAIAAPSIPYASNVTGEWITEGDVSDPAYWGRHIRQAVQFSPGMTRVLEDPDRALLEVGPGRVLGTLARQQPTCGADRVVVPSLRPATATGDDNDVLLAALGRLWTGGVNVDWNRLHAGARRRRVILPTYPFERERYWIEPGRAAPGSPATASARRADLADWFYAPTWRRTLEPAVSDVTATRLVLTDGSRFATRIAEQMKAEGCPVVVAIAGAGFARDGDDFTIDPSSRDDCRKLLSELAEDDRAPRHVIHLLGLSPRPAREDADAVQTCLDRCFYAPLALMQAIDDAGLSGAMRLDFVTAGVHDVSADDAICPENATILGPVRVIGCEFPDVTCRNVDVAMHAIDDDDHALVARIARELLSSSADPIVAYRGERRFVESLAPTPIGEVMHEPPARLRAGATYLITGGLGGIGLELARYLVRAVNANLVLTTRSPLPNRTDWSSHVATHGEDDATSVRIRAVEGLERLGAQVMVADADVTDLERMRAVLDEAGDRLGPVRGVIHAAGVPGEGVILLKERAAADRVLAPKVGGARVLERLIEGRDLDFVVLCSSLAAAVGIAGQVDYCAANAYLDAFAHDLAKRTGTYAVSIAWNRWREVGMAYEAARAAGHTRAIEGSSNREGVELFRRVLAGWNEPYVAIAERDPFEMLRPAPRRAADETTGPDAVDTPARDAGHARPNLPTAYVAPRTAAEQTLARIWGDLLGIASIGVHDNFFDLGGHSLLATQVMARVRETMRIEAPIKAIFDAPTVAELADAIGAPAAPPVETETPSTSVSADAAARPVVSITPRAGGGDAPMSHHQQRLWILDRIEPGLAIYNSPTTSRLTGSLDEDAFLAALHEIGRRHATMRTTFTQRNGSPVQIVHAEPKFEVVREDLSALAEPDRHAALERRVDELSTRPFDLEHGPLVRIGLFRLAGDETAFTLVMHHIITDAWSLGIIHRELGTLYEAFRHGRPSPLEPLSIQYADFAAWHRDWLQGETLDELMSYWRRTLAGAPPALPLQTDRPRPPVPSYRGAVRRFQLSPAASAAVNDIAVQASASPFMVLLALYKVLLAHWSGETDVVVGTPIAGRQHKALEDLVGFFINTLVLRTDVAGEPSFREVLDRVRAGALDAYAHQELPFEQLVDELQPERHLSMSPLFQVLFMVLNAPTESFQLGDLAVRPLAMPYAQSKFDMTMSMVESAGRWGGYVEYATDLFDVSTIDRMISAFERLAETLLVDPDQSIAGVVRLDEAERHRLLVEWNDTARAVDETSIDQRVAQQAAQTPDAAAVVAGDATLSYRELDERANRLARHLRASGVGTGMRVAICMDRDPALVVAMLGVLRAGGAYVPLDPDHPARRRAIVLQDAAASLVLTQQAHAAAFADGDAPVLRLDTAWPTIAAHAADPLPPVHAPGDVAYVIFTSGSTGRPKGVCVTHGGLANYLGWSVEAYGLGPGSVSLVHSSIAFDLTVTSLLAPLVSGGAVYLLPDAPGVEALAAAVRAANHVDLVKITPAHVELLSRTLSAGERARVGTLVIGGENLTAEHVAFWAGDGVTSRLVNEYGPTETVVGVSAYEVSSASPRNGSVPIGRPIANAQLYVLDSRLEPVPVGVAGELYIGGAGVARGYLDQARMTAERFVPDPFGQTPGARLYRTGDVARHRPDGELEFLGRNDEQVKVRGHRIELGEVAAVALEHPDVEQAVVVTREDRGDVQLVAYVVAGDGLEAATLRGFLQPRLPEPMIPSAVVRLDAIPLAPSGKVDRDALPAPTAERQVQVTFVAPRGELEDQIAAAWRAVLGLEQVGIRDNFFELGGHSLKLLQVHERLIETIGDTLSVMDLFRFPTIESLADHLAGTATERSLQDEARARVRRRGGTDETAIAVVGMAGRFPGAPDVDTLWSNLRDGVESIRFFTDDELRAAGVDEALIADPNYVKARGYLEDADQFDAWFFGYNPREAELIDPQQRLFLECAWKALEQAGCDPSRYDGMIGVYAGAGMNTYLANVQSHPELLRAAGGLQLVISSDKDFLPTRVSYKLNLRGPSVTVQTACSTSLVAIHEACRSLLEHRCDMALAGGVSVTVPRAMGYLHQPGSIASPDGHCRAFDANAGGTLGGSGVGVVVLKRLDAALRDGDRIHAVVRGSATNNDGGQKVGYTAPSIDGQAEVIAMAQAFAGVDPDTVTYVEAHGTGTALGDPIEVAALTRVFREQTDRRGFCALGSIKTNMGHLDAAAGVAGFIKTVLALEHGEIPPSLHFESPNPEIDFASSPFYVSATRRAWETDHAPRRAGVSSFGIGGTNAHVVLEEAPIVEPSTPGRPGQLVPLSAKSESALTSASVGLAAHLRERDDANLADVAFTLQTGRCVFEHRRAIVGTTADEIATALEGGNPTAVVTGQAPTSTREVVFMFPGQGAQYVDMGRGLYDDEPSFRAAIDRCFRWLEREMDLDLRSVLYPADGPTEALSAKLKQTSITQPALFVIEYALAQLWMSWGVKPVACIGHSIGEFAAACIAGVLTMEDALRLVVTRGRLMEQMPAGVMTTVPLPAERVRALVDADPGLWLAAVNAPWLSVVSGPEDRVAALETQLGAEGVACRRVRTSHAFHSGLMEGAVEPFVEAVGRVSLAPPTIPFVSNMTGDWITEADACDPAYWGRHIRETVRFADGLTPLLTGSDRVLLEVGPGRVLGTLARQHPDAGRGRVIVPSIRPPKTERPDAAFALEALARLWTQGVEVDWSGVHEGERRHRVPLPTYPFERERYWIDRNRRAARTDRARLDDWFHVPAWRRGRPLAAKADADASITTLVVTDGSALAERIANGLTDAGRDVARMDVALAARRTDAARFLAELAGAGRAPQDVVHVAAGVDGTEEDAIEHCFHAPIATVQAFDEAGLGVPRRLHVVTAGVHEIAAGDTIVPARATALGPCRVIGEEMPGVTGRHIDLAVAERDDATTIDALVRELTGDAEDPVVGIRAGRRYLQSFARVPLVAPDEPAPALLRTGGTYLITGGLGGMGLELAAYLARSAGANLVLTTRSAMPARDAWDAHVAAHDEDDRTSRRIHAVRALETDGAEVLVAEADVTDLDGMRSVVDAARARFGAINGVVHAAGQPGDGVILRKTRDVANAVLAPKVQGTRVLAALFAEADLDFLVLCSSLTSVKAEPGQVDYCAANAFLDAFARQFAAATGTYAVSIDWNRWGEVGMAADAARARGHVGRLDGATSAEGVEAFRRILDERLEPHVVVSHRDLWHELSGGTAAADRGRADGPDTDRPAVTHARPALPTAYAAPSSGTEEAIIDIWQQMLGVEPIGVHDNFFDLGGHSLLATQVLSRMRDAFDLPLALADLFDAPTVNAMATRIETKVLGEMTERKDNGTKHV